MNFFEYFLLFFAFHNIADYPLQGEWLSKIKNHKLSVVPNETIWPIALLGHSSIHAIFVYFISGLFSLAIVELILHSIIDYLKCDGKINYIQDQSLHLLCKAFYVFLILMM